jgi:sorbose reductase
MEKTSTTTAHRRLVSIRSAVMSSSSAPTSIRHPNPPLSDSVFKMFDMHGKVVIVTGGSGGIGYEVAKGLAEAGADVALFYKSATNADELAANLEHIYNVRSKAYQCAVESLNKVEP